MYVSGCRRYFELVDVCLVGYIVKDVEREREQETGTAQDTSPGLMAKGNSKGVALEFCHAGVSSIIVRLCLCQQ